MRHAIKSSRPPPQPMTKLELRQAWLSSRDPTLRRVLREVARLHGTLEKIENCRKSIEKVWLDEVGERLIALYELRCMLREEPGIFDMSVADRKPDEPPPFR